MLTYADPFLPHAGLMPVHAGPCRYVYGQDCVPRLCFRNACDLVADLKRIDSAPFSTLDCHRLLTSSTTKRDWASIFDLIRVPYGLYGVTYIGLVSLLASILGYILGLGARFPLHHPVLLDSYIGQNPNADPR